MKLIAIRGHTHDHVPPDRCRFCAGWGKLQPHRILASGERVEGEVCQVCRGSGEIRPKPSYTLDPLAPPPLAQPGGETPGRA
jgi:DnaJ-class molecular chaperone